MSKLKCAKCGADIGSVLAARESVKESRLTTAQL